MEVRLPFGFRKGDNIFDICQVRGLTGKEATLLYDAKKQASMMKDILNACVVKICDSEGVEYKELREAVNGLTLEDRDCILIAIRKATWNSDIYILHNECPSCGVTQSVDVNLVDSFPIKYPEKVYSWEADVLGMKFVFKLLTVKEENEGNISLLNRVEQEAKQELLKNAKMSPEQQQIMVRLKMNEMLNVGKIFQEHLAKIVVSVDGKPIKNVDDIEALPLPVVQEIGEVWMNTKPQGGVDLNINVTCGKCGEKHQQHLFEASGSSVGLSGIVHFFGIKPPNSAVTR